MNNSLAPGWLKEEVFRTLSSPIYQRMAQERKNAERVQAVLLEFSNHPASMAQVIVYLRAQIDAAVKAGLGR